MTDWRGIADGVWMSGDRTGFRTSPATTPDTPLLVEIVRGDFMTGAKRWHARAAWLALLIAPPLAYLQNFPPLYVVGAFAAAFLIAWVHMRAVVSLRGSELVLRRSRWPWAKAHLFAAEDIETFRHDSVTVGGGFNIDTGQEYSRTTFHAIEMVLRDERVVPISCASPEVAQALIHLFEGDLLLRERARRRAAVMNGHRTHDAGLGHTPPTGGANPVNGC